MQPFTTLTGVAVPLLQDDINTDQITPINRDINPDYAKLLFANARRRGDGSLDPDFPLNQPAWRESKIVVGGANFGVGSSREAAVYALYDQGIRCVIAASFGDIFAQNSVKNGLLPATVSAADIAELTDLLKRNPEFAVTVDLEAQTIACGNHSFGFSIAPSWREQLLNGWDEIDLTRSHQTRIDAFRQSRREAAPWVFPSQ